LYAAQLNLAHQAWESANISRLMELLEGQKPKPGQQDLREFDWYYLWRLCHSEIFTFNHPATVNSVAFSPDGKIVATGCKDGNIRLWDIANGKLLTTLKRHNAQVNSLAFSPDSKKLVTASFDNSIKLWDLATGQELMRFSGHSDSVFAV